MKQISYKHTLVVTMSAILLASVNVWADGTETLGTPSIPIASGTGIAAAGTGLISQPGYLDIDVPAGTIKQVLVYWEGHMTNNVPGDSTIIINGNVIDGTLIGGATKFFNNAFSSTFRADITALGLVSTGPNSLAIEGLEYTRANNGAGVMVIYDDGSTAASIEIRDGNDLAYFDFAPPLDTTVPQTFSFAAADSARTATLSMFFSSVAGTVSGSDVHRPSAIQVTTNPGGVVTVHDNLLDSIDGEEWDTIVLPVSIPAGTTSLTVQALSADNLGTGDRPASFAWNAAGLSVPGIPISRGGEGCTPGYWKQAHHFDSWVGYNPNDNYETVFGVDASFDKTLLGALQQGGGGEKALGRQAVAALLNAASPDADFFYTQAEVIAKVQEAYATGNFNGIKDLLETQNDPTPCPLN